MSQTSKLQPSAYPLPFTSCCCGLCTCRCHAESVLAKLDLSSRQRGGPQGRLGGGCAGWRTHHKDRLQPRSPARRAARPKSMRPTRDSVAHASQKIRDTCTARSELECTLGLRCVSGCFEYVQTHSNSLAVVVLREIQAPKSRPDLPSPLSPVLGVHIVGPVGKILDPFTIRVFGGAILSIRTSFSLLPRLDNTPDLHIRAWNSASFRRRKGK
jgi:hypothetical protein